MNQGNNYCVYKHTFPNKKVYIGITSQSLEKRFANGRGYKKCPKMHNAIMKYGWNNVEHELLFSGLSKEDAERKEIEMIAFYGSVENGYNTDHGGNTTGTHSIETRKRISEGNTGKTKPHFTEERKAEYSRKFSGENNPFYGKHHTSVTKQKHSKFMQGNQFNSGNHHTEEFKKWKSKQMHDLYANGGNPRCKKVIGTDADGHESEFCSLRQAAAHLGKSASVLCKHIKTGNDFCGYVWRYTK